MSLCRQLILIQVLLHHTQTSDWLLRSLLLSYLWLIALPLQSLPWVLILYSHEPKPASSKSATQHISDSWVPLDFFQFFLHPSSLNDSNLLLRILLGSLLWIKKFKPCKTIVSGFWFLDPPTPTLWVPNGCFEPNICLTDLLNVSKPFLLTRATHKYLVLTTLTLLALSSRPLVRVVLYLVVTNK